MPTSRCLTRTRRRLKYATGDTFIAAPIPALRHRPRPPPIRAQPLLAVAIPSSLPGRAGLTSVNLLRYRGRLAGIRTRPATATHRRPWASTPNRAV